jgi:hypothetical protein
MSISQLHVYRRLEITKRELENIRRTKGDEAAKIMCSGLVAGVTEYLVHRYGMRHTYNFVQRLADGIAEEGAL